MVCYILLHTIQGVGNIYAQKSTNIYAEHKMELIPTYRGVKGPNVTQLPHYFSLLSRPGLYRQQRK